MADNLTREQRSRTMSRIRRADTGPELTVRRLLHAQGLRFRLHVSSLPGCPDVVFVRARVIVFIDGDFWHGWKFDQWRHKLAPYWAAKIARNRARDRSNFRKLRRRGWKVVRVWEHQIERDALRCTERIIAIIERALAGAMHGADAAPAIRHEGRRRVSRGGR
jgi:DNA mismatch endonuclease (patch repair protein)